MASWGHNLSEELVSFWVRARRERESKDAFLFHSRNPSMCLCVFTFKIHYSGGCGET
jgi:hypothetical protein